MNSLLNNLTSKEVCLIDKFFVAKNAVEEFNQRMNYNRNFIRQLSGFIEDKVYTQIDERGDFHIITIAEWESIEHINEAKNAVQSEYKRIGFNMTEFIERLNIKIERGLYNKLEDDNKSENDDKADNTELPDNNENIVRKKDWAA